METRVAPRLYSNGLPALPGSPAFTGSAESPARLEPWHAPGGRGDMGGRGDTNEAGLADVAIVPIWLGCLTVGILGMLLPYHRAHLAAKVPPPVVLEPVPVRLVPKQMLPQADLPKVSPKPDAAPPPPDDAAPPVAPPLPSVALPSPAIAFAVPVEGPVQIVDARQAMSGGRASVVARAPPVRHLTLGVGEGQQPSPEYPDDARKAHEEGTVVIRFTVGPDGRVISAEVSQPSHWPLLNQAALRTIRYSWRLSPGKAGTYDIPIQFVLTGNQTRS
jgi:TonB family protein